jgi:hypothetical protein
MLTREGSLTKLLAFPARPEVTLSASPAGRSPALARICALSRPFVILFSALFGGAIVFVGGLMVALVFYGGPHLRVGPASLQITTMLDGETAGTVPTGDLPLVTRLGMSACAFLAMSPAIFILWHLRGLFALYAGGTVFAGENAARLRAVGVWLIVNAVAPFASHQIAVLTGGIDRAWFHAVSLEALVLGGMLFVIARVVDLGREIEQDQAGFL